MNREFHDPLGYYFPLPLTGCFYPLGVPLVVETNSETILNLASSLWSRWPARTGAEPARFRIAVDPRDSAGPLTAVHPRGQHHLVSITHSYDNFAVCDLRSSFAFCGLTQDVAADSEYVRYHFLEPVVYLMIDAAHLAPLHASCIAWKGRAVVLCGDSGAGKTTLAYACARRGWTYLSDDATHIVREQSVPWVAGRPFRIRFRESARGLFPELRQFVPHRRLNGKLDIEVDTDQLGLSVATDCEANRVVFLDRQAPDCRPGLYEYCADRAARELQTLVCYGDEQIRRAQKSAMQRFLQLPIAKLTYGDSDSAEETLRALMES